jgi:hypothetical protein
LELEATGGKIIAAYKKKALPPVDKGKGIVSFDVVGSHVGRGLIFLKM